MDTVWIEPSERVLVGTNTSKRGFSLETLTWGSGWNLSQMVPEASEKVPCGTVIEKVQKETKKSCLKGISQRTLCGSSKHLYF